MFGWGNDGGWFHSNRNEFLHVIETHITTFSGLKEGEKATISLENNKKISTKPDLKTGVSKNVYKRLMTCIDNQVLAYFFSASDIMEASEAVSVSMV